MQRMPVSSRSALEIGYDRSAKTLEVMFHEGAVYRYFDVPAAIFRALMNADSLGAYLNRHIRDHYRYEKISD
jgi:hypothetical protein